MAAAGGSGSGSGSGGGSGDGGVDGVVQVRALNPCRGGKVVGGRYRLGKVLGEGAFGLVRLGLDLGAPASAGTGEGEEEEKDGGGAGAGGSRGPQRQVAVKVMDAVRVRDHYETVRREVMITQRVRHENVVDMLDLVQTKRHVYMVMEVMRGGELFELLAAEKRFSEPRARTYFQQLMRAVEHLHSVGVCHRDLKPENLLLTEDQKTLKLTDFGLSSMHVATDGDGVRVHRDVCGTPQYLAPEIIADVGYTGDAVDVWSCGVILFVLVAGSLPFNGRSQEELYERIQVGAVRYPATFSAELKALLAKILVVDPAERATVDDIKRDPWFSVGFEDTEWFLRSSNDLAAAGTAAAAGSGGGRGSGGAGGKTPRLRPNRSKSMAVAEARAEADAVGEGDVVDSSDDETHGRTHVHVDGLRITNAFDLIALSGIFDMAPALHHNGVAGGAGATGAAAADGVVTRGRVMRNTSFTSSHAPDRILHALEQALQEVAVSVRVFPKAHRIRAEVKPALDGAAVVQLSAQIFVLAADLYLIEFSKRAGDFLLFHRVFRTVRDRCSHIIRDEGSSSSSSAPSSSSSSSSSGDSDDDTNSASRAQERTKGAKHEARARRKTATVKKTKRSSAAKTKKKKRRFASLSSE